MLFVPRSTKNKVPMKNKSLYMPVELAERLERIAAAYNTSFNNIVVSMVECCIENMNPKETNRP